jgi:hypothetical protein
VFGTVHYGFPSPVNLGIFFGSSGLTVCVVRIGQATHIFLNDFAMSHQCQLLALEFCVYSPYFIFTGRMKTLRGA